jgi:hypothetical protein
MTALAGREVDRTFSAVRRYSTGLPGLKTHEPGREDFPELGQPITRSWRIEEGRG